MNMTLMMLADKILKGTEPLNGIEITSMTVIGMGVVFAALLILITFLYLSGGMFKRMDEKKKTTPTVSAAPAPVKAAPAKAVASAPAAAADDDEIIAVITAAIAAMSAADGKAYRLHSVKPVSRGGNGRSAWAQAGIHDATRPF